MSTEELTPEAIDEEFPLQQPDGLAMAIKQSLNVGQSDKAQLMLQNLRAADHETVEHTADELAGQHFPDGFSLDVMRALRLGVARGLKLGQQQGAEVVKFVTESQTESATSQPADPRYDSGGTGADGSGNEW
jgi:hypothetical protein